MRKAYTAVRPYVRLATAVAIIVALTAQFQLAIDRGNFVKANFFVVYVVYSLIRGPIAHWYPYPFLDPNLDGGAGKVAITIVVLVPCVVLIAFGLVKLVAIGRSTPAAAI